MYLVHNKKNKIQNEKCLYQNTKIPNHHTTKLPNYQNTETQKKLKYISYKNSQNDKEREKAKK